MTLQKATPVFLFLIALWMLGFAWYSAAALTLKPDVPEQQTDAIVVLTGGDQRIEKGLQLLADGKSKNLFISGVHKDVTDAEIRQMLKNGATLPACCIALGREAKSTIENAAETKTWVADHKFTSIRLVTANYHMPRAALELSHAMPDVTILRSPVVQPNPKIFSVKFSILMFSEYNKFLFRRVYLAATDLA